jgi:uncharacterized protein
VFLSIRFFEAHGRDLLAAVHVASRLHPRSVAVLLCNPFGEEAARAHRLYRVMARKLEDAGYSAMRFDYSGTGDSSGDIADFGVEDWLQDIAAAAEQLRRESNVQRIVLVGLRLVGTLAALCAQRGLLRAAHVLLWDPVADGADYLRELGRAHRAYMQVELGRQAAIVADDDSTDDASHLQEALGTPINARLRSELAGIDLSNEVPTAAMTTVLCTQRTPAMERLRAQWTQGPRMHWIDLDSSSGWNSDAALNNNVVPMNEMLALIARIETCHP